jgi:cell division protein FtsB
VTFNDVDTYDYFRDNLVDLAETDHDPGDYDAAKEKILEADKEYAALIAERQSIEAAIQALGEGTAEAPLEVDARSATADEAIAGIQADLQRHEQIEKADARIKELSDQERELAKEYEDLEQQVFLAEEFTRAKVGLLEKKINSRFDLARFKLFDVQVNGALSETCTTTYDGVPFDSLNHGARLNVGLDIINTLADFYDFTPPVWIDNAESVTSIIPTRGQAIKLVVSAKDKKLRIERTTEILEEVAA